MFAVIQSGGKQYKVAAGDVITVEKLDAEVGANVDFGEVLMLGGDGAAEVGRPFVEGAQVKATVLDQTRGDKIIVFKKKRRKNYRRTRGHRQALTVLRVTGIEEGGAPKKAAAKPKTAAKKTKDTGKAKAAPTAKGKTGDAAAKPTASEAKPKTSAKAASAAKTGAKTAARPKTAKAKSDKPKAPRKTATGAKAKSSGKAEKE